ncbi:hypothetical protein [uncultured Porphyromonas sp.]|nr:hypothetical protein [uncultured Porphyromonas sp.]
MVLSISIVLRSLTTTVLLQIIVASLALCTTPLRTSVEPPQSFSTAISY